MMRSRQAAVAFIFITVALDMLAFGLIAPVLPKLLLGFLGGNSASTAKMLGVFGTVFALMQFIFSPVLGVLSDRFGRRPVVLLSNFGLSLDYVVMAMAPTIGWLFIGRVVTGITASSISTGMAYISDVVPPEKRAGAFGILGVSFGLGFVLGPALGGLLGNADARLPFWVAGGLSLLNALYGYFILPESLPVERRKPFTLRRANPVGSLLLLRSHATLARLATIKFISYIAHEVFVIWGLYANYRFGWSSTTIGVSLAMVGVCSMMVSGGLVRVAVARLGERRALWIGQLMGGVGMWMAGFATNDAAYFACIPVIALWGISDPACQGLMTSRVGESEQGELQGAIQSLRALATIIGPGLFSFTMAYFINPRHGWNFPGAPWILAGALLLVAMALSTRVGRDEVDDVAKAGRRSSIGSRPRRRHLK